MLARPRPPVLDMSILWPEFVKEDGRSINVTCRLTDNDQCHAGTWFELYDNRTRIVLARKPCQADIRDRAVFPVTLKENTPFGQFRCRYGGKAISSNALQISYRFCKLSFFQLRSCSKYPFLGSDDSRSCQQSSTCDSDAEMKFCVAHKNGISVCSKITDRDWCIAEERRSVFKFCPIQQRSLCSAIFHNYQAVWFKMYHTDGSCPYGGRRDSSGLAFLVRMVALFCSHAGSRQVHGYRKTVRRTVRC